MLRACHFLGTTASVKDSDLADCFLSKWLTRENMVDYVVLRYLLGQIPEDRVLPSREDHSDY